MTTTKTTSDSAIAEGKINAIKADNQVVFRKFNERLSILRDDLDKIPTKQGAIHYTSGDDAILNFVCECSDENCETKIHLSLKEYIAVHHRNDTFSIAPNHEAFGIEHVTVRTPEYSVVQKFETPSQSAKRLHRTNVNNSPYKA